MSFIQAQRKRGNLKKVVTTLSPVELGIKGLNKLAFDQALKHSKSIEDITEKVEFKKIHLPQFLPTALKYVEAGKVENESLLLNIALWCFDVGDIESAILLSIFCIEQDVEAPIWFSNPLEVTLNYQFCEWASPKINKGESVEPYLEKWLKAAEGWEEINDIQRAMFKVFLGKIAHQQNKFEEAVVFYQEALKINSGAGVKTNLKRAKKEQDFPIKKSD